MKKSGKLLFFLVFLFLLINGVSIISASDVNDTYVLSDDTNSLLTNQIDVDNQDKIISKNKYNDSSNEVKSSDSTQTIYVNGNTGDDFNTGMSSSDAYETITKALDDGKGDYGWKVNRTIYVSSGTYYLKNLNIRYSNIEIIGSGIDKTIIDGDGNTIIDNAIFSNITLRNLSVRNGYSSTSSVFNLKNDVHTTINQVKFTNNIGKYGGVIRTSHSKSSIIITNSIFDGNTATNRGGAIETSAGYEYIKNCTFTNNVVSDYSTGSTTGYGGAIYKAAESRLYVLDSTFTNNCANRGGAIYVVEKGIIDIRRCKFISNVAKHDSINLNMYISGGAVYVASGFSNISDSTFKNNQAQEGGAICINSDSEQNITNCIFTNNYAIFRGGAIKNDGELTISKCTFDNNSAESNGGVLFSVDHSDRIFIYDSSFTNNKATNASSYGGVIYLISTKSFLSFDNCYFKNNSAYNGGVIGTYSQSGVIRIYNSNFESNSAYDTGGVICARAVNLDLVISNSKFINSKSTNEGGTFYFGGSDSNYELNKVNITNSVTNSKGGAIYIRNNAYLNIYNSYFKNCKAIEGGVIFNNILPIMNIGYTTFENNVATYGSVIYNYKAIDSAVNYNNFINNGNSTIFSVYANFNARNNYWSASTVNSQTDNRNMSSSIFKLNKYVIYVNPKVGNDTNEGTSSKPLKTLNKAINKYASAELTIYLSEGTYVVKNIIITSNTEIIGVGSEKTILTGSNNILFTFKATKVALKNLTLMGGTNSNGLGGVVSINNSFSELRIENAVVKNNKAMSGGVIASILPNVRVSLINSTFINNTANNGGIVYSSSIGTKLYAEALTIKDSTSIGNGGSFYLDGNNSNYNFFNVKFVNSVSNRYGGAIYVINDSYMVLHKVTFDSNKALRGGAVYMNTSKKLYARNCVFINNFALIGGAIFYSEYENTNTIMLNSFIQYCRFNNNTNNSIYSNINLNAIYNWWGSNNGNNTTSAKVNATRPIVINITAEKYEFNKLKFKFILHYLDENKIEQDINGLLNELVVYSNDTRIETISTSQVTNLETELTCDDYSEIKFRIDNQIITFKNTMNGNYVNRIFSITNDNFDDGRINTKITINKIANTQYTDKTTIKGTLKTTTGTLLKSIALTVNINGKKVGTTTDANGTFTYKYKTNTPGTNNVTVSYAGNLKYKATSTKTTFTVTTKATKIVINKIANTQYTDKATIKGTFQSSSGKPLPATLTITINGKKYTTKSDANGTFTLKYKTTAVGTNNVTVSYAGNLKYKATSTKTTFTVTTKATKIVINKIANTQYTDKATIKGTFQSSSGKLLPATLTITINGKKYTTKSDANGTFTLKYKTTVIGTNNVTVSYAGNKKYSSSTAKTTFITNKLNTIITVGSSKIVSVDKQMSIYGKLTDKNGNNLAKQQITIKVDGKTYKTNTTTYGNYKIQITPTTTGSKTITVSYAGNSKIVASSNSTTFQVKQDTIITVGSTKTVQINKQMSVYGKLTDNNGKNLANQQITIKVDGKTYTTNTTQYGNYNIKITPTTTGSKTITTTYKGTNTYLSSTSTSTFTVVKT